MHSGCLRRIACLLRGARGGEGLSRLLTGGAVVQLWRCLQALKGSGGSLHHGSCLLQQGRVAEGGGCHWWQPAGRGVGSLEGVDVTTAVGALVAW